MNKARLYLLMLLGGVLLTQLLGCLGSTSFQVIFTSRHDLQVGDRVTMQDVAIGEITQLELTESGAIACTVVLDSKYKEYVKTSAVFSYQKDAIQPDRNCLICKNCDKLSPVIQSGHTFSGMGLIGYSLACIGQQSNEIWDGFLKKSIEELITSGGDFSSETEDKIEAFARTSQEAFAQTLEELNELIEQLDEDARETLIEIQKNSQQK